MTTADTAEHVGVPCPACSPESDTVHEVLKPGGQATVQCTNCGHVHQTRLEPDRSIAVDVVISQDGESITTTVDRSPDATVAVDDEFIVESDVGIFTVRITSLELDGQQRVETATVADVQTIWTRAVGNVSVPMTVHPKAGTGDRNQTYSTDLQLPGDHEFVVGETVTIGDETVTIEGLHLRSPRDDDPSKLDNDGDDASAKDIKRVYARDETTDPWSPW